MLDLAKVMLREILAALRTEIEAGTPIVVLEPSCASVFKEELINLLPHDQDALRLNKLVTPLGDFLNGLEGWVAPRLEREILVHGHCHHKALLKMDGVMKAIKATGADADFIDAGCCGMAGAFGFEAGEHYDVSVKAGELALLPAVRDAKPETIIIGDGFSCREQIAQTTDRQALHLADVLWLGLRYGPAGPPGDRPELAAMPDARTAAERAKSDGVLLLTAALVCGGLAIAAIRLLRGSADE
jgi:Fe-S oxidoreductase